MRQLAEIDAKLAALPAELAALKKRGAEDVVAERARIEQDALVERQRVLEHTRREIDMRLRVAKRELLGARRELAVNVASERIRTSITPDDQARLVDRYAAQLPDRETRSDRRRGREPLRPRAVRRRPERRRRRGGCSRRRPSCRSSRTLFTSEPLAHILGNPAIPVSKKKGLAAALVASAGPGQPAACED